MFYDKSWLWICRAWLVTPYGLLWQYLWWTWCQLPNKYHSSDRPFFADCSDAKLFAFWKQPYTPLLHRMLCSAALDMSYLISPFPCNLLSLERVRSVGWSHTAQVGSIDEEAYKFSPRPAMFPALCRNLVFITVFTIVWLLCQSWARLIRDDLF
jgi:hypothetical protein